MNFNHLVFSTYPIQVLVSSAFSHNTTRAREATQADESKCDYYTSYYNCQSSSQIVAPEYLYSLFRISYQTNFPHNNIIWDRAKNRAIPFCLHWCEFHRRHHQDWLKLIWMTGTWPIHIAFCCWQCHHNLVRLPSTERCLEFARNVRAILAPKLVYSMGIWMELARRSFSRQQQLSVCACDGGGNQNYIRGPSALPTIISTICWDVPHYRKCIISFVETNDVTRHVYENFAQIRGGLASISTCDGERRLAVLMVAVSPHNFSHLIELWFADSCELSWPTNMHIYTTLVVRTKPSWMRRWELLRCSILYTCVSFMVEPVLDRQMGSQLVINLIDRHKSIW